MPQYLRNQWELLKRKKEIERAGAQLKKLPGIDAYGLCFLGMDGRIVQAGPGKGGVGNADLVGRRLKQIAKRFRLVVAVATVKADDNDEGLTAIVAQGPVRSGHEVDEDLAYTVHGMKVQQKLWDGHTNGDL